MTAEDMGELFEERHEHIRGRHEMDKSGYGQSTMRTVCLSNIQTCLYNRGQVGDEHMCSRPRDTFEYYAT